MPDTQRRPMPNWSMDGIPNFGNNVHWLTFDATKGILFCRDTRIEFEELLCIVVHATAVRVFSDSGGRVLCASDDRVTSNYGKPGQRCANCEHNSGLCRVRWRVWLQNPESGAIYAHTLSVTGSINFVNYAKKLQASGHLFAEVITNVFVEDYVRKRSGLSFRRLQFACASDGSLT